MYLTTGSDKDKAAVEESELNSLTWGLRPTMRSFSQNTISGLVGKYL